MSTQPTPFLTPAQYLEIERKASYKSEYFRGQMFAISGASRRHIDLTVELAALLKQHIRGKNCHVHNSDMRVLVPAAGLYTYPDLSVTCGTREFADAAADILTNPILLVEVLSPSTERYDRIAKVSMYQTISTVRECLIVAQDTCCVELHQRTGDQWIRIEAIGRDASIDLDSIGYTLRLRDLYETAIPESEQP